MYFKYNNTNKLAQSTTFYVITKYSAEVLGKLSIQFPTPTLG